MHRFWLAITVALGLCLWAAPARAKSRRFAVVIGANQGGIDDAPLRYAERDAERVGRVLRELGGVLAEDLVVLRAPDDAGVKRVMRTMAARVRSRPAKEDTILYVYYSGHADPAGLHLGRSTLGLKKLRRLIDAIPADVRVLVLDACRSGAVTRVKGGRPAKPFVIAAEDGVATKGTAVITSSAAGEDAQESDALQGGIFSHHFVVGLMGAADRSADGRVTLTEAYRYAYAATLRTSSGSRFIQHPTYSFALKGRSGLVVTKLGRGGKRGQLELTAAGRYLVFEGAKDGPVIAEVALDKRRTLVLPPGLYFVRRRSGDAAYERTVRVATKRRTVLTAEQMKRVPYGRTVRKGMRLEQPVAGALVSGFEMGGPLLEGLGIGLYGALGMRFDFEPISLQLRARYGRYTADNAPLQLDHHMVGGDVAALKLFDIGPFSPGLGVRAGFDWIHQRFDSPGEAPSRSAWAARGGPLLHIGWSPTALLFVGLDGGLDAYLLQRVPAGSGGTDTTTSALSARVVPYGMAGLGLYVF